MTTSKKTEAANRHYGGPGSHHQREDLPDPTKGRGPLPGQPTNGPQSDVSGGGGIRDSHQAHDPNDKGGH